MEELIRTIQELNKISFIDIIQVVISVLSMVISGFALFYAIKVPKTIANEQNRIALLEKRTQTYLVFEKMIKGILSLPLTLRNAHGLKLTKKYDVFTEEFNTNFAMAGFLFSPDLNHDIERLKDLYNWIHLYDCRIYDGLSLINNDEEKNLILELFMKDFREEIKESELEELKMLCQKYKFDEESYDEDGECEYISTDLYKLSCEQQVYEKEADELGPIVLENMRKEIQISNNI